MKIIKEDKRKGKEKDIVAVKVVAVVEVVVIAVEAVVAADIVALAVSTQ